MRIAVGIVQNEHASQARIVRLIHSTTHSMRTATMALKVGLCSISIPLSVGRHNVPLE